MFRAVDAEEFSESTSLTASDSDCASRNELQPIESTQIPKTPSKEITLKMILKELFFCIALALTTYGALHNSQAKISKQPQASRFFSRSSPVLDWYKGDLSAALDVVNQVDVAFVMYYAPWDAECQYVRKEFEKAAHVLGDRVSFSAINCWHPGSECRTHHSKLSSWPVLMAYSLTTRGIIYKGPRDAQSMVNFLELIIKPLKRVSNTEDLVYLLSVCDVVAVGFTPLTDHSRDYAVWYNTALKALEFDVLGEICFAAVTSEELASELSVESLPSARLMLWNDTKEFDGTRNTWNSSSVLEWILDGYSSAATRILPMWKKAFSFARYADGRPILLLFTPLNPLYEQLPNYALLREVAMEYYNCNNSESHAWVTEQIKLQRMQRHLYQQRDIKKFCSEYKYKTPKYEHSVDKATVSQYTKYSYNSTANKQHKNSQFSFLLRRHPTIARGVEGSDDMITNIGFMDECSSQLFPAEKDLYSMYEKCQTIEQGLNIEEMLRKKMETSMLPTEDDKLSPENLVQDAVKHYCDVMNFAYTIQPPVFPGKDDGNITSIEGLACASNITLHILAVDSIVNYHFAEALGIDIKKRKDMTAAVILDSEQETQHVLSGPYTARSIRDFISRFASRSLRRSLRSAVTADHTHHFAPNGTYDVEIEDLGTSGLRRLMYSRGTVSLVAVCGGSCPAHTTRSLVSAARLLSKCNVKVRVGRIDALRHDLPWHLTTEYYPTLLVFPPDGSGDASSLSAGAGRRAGVGAAVAGALRALPPPARLRARLDLCHILETRVEKRSCLRDVREHLTSVINRNLQSWRRTKEQAIKDILYTRLLVLHRVHFDLSLLDITDFQTSSSKKQNLLDSIEVLAKNWQDGDLTLNRRKNNIDQVMRS